MREKTVYLDRARIWAEHKPTKEHPDKVDIRIALNDELISTVNNVSGERCHPHMFGHLRAIIQKEGKWPVS
jgi:hypothetical protein